MRKNNRELKRKIIKNYPDFLRYFRDMEQIVKSKYKGKGYDYFNENNYLRNKFQDYLIEEVKKKGFIGNEAEEVYRIYKDTKLKSEYILKLESELDDIDYDVFWNLPYYENMLLGLIKKRYSFSHGVWYKNKYSDINTFFFYKFLERITESLSSRIILDHPDYEDRLDFQQILEYLLKKEVFYTYDCGYVELYFAKLLDIDKYEKYNFLEYEIKLEEFNQRLESVIIYKNFHLIESWYLIWGRYFYGNHDQQIAYFQRIQNDIEMDLTMKYSEKYEKIEHINLIIKTIIKEKEMYSQKPREIINDNEESLDKIHLRLLKDKLFDPVKFHDNTIKYNVYTTLTNLAIIINYCKEHFTLEFNQINFPLSLDDETIFKKMQDFIVMIQKGRNIVHFNRTSFPQALRRKKYFKLNKKELEFGKYYSMSFYTIAKNRKNYNNKWLFDYYKQ